MSSSISQALSSHTKRRGTTHDDIDRSVYTVGQTLVSIVNDPRTAGQPQGGSWFFGGGGDAPQADAPPPPIDASRYPPVTLQDLGDYLKVVRGTYERFVRDRASLEAFDQARPGRGSASGGGGGSGAGAEGTPFASGARGRRRGGGAAARLSTGGPAARMRDTRARS